MEPSRALPTIVAPQPFSVGGVIGRTFSTWSKNLVPFVTLSLVVNAPNFLLGVWTQYQIYGGYPSFQQQVQRGALAAQRGPFAGFTFATVVVALVTMFLTLVQMGALTYGGIQHLAGRKVTVRALLDAGVRRAGSVFAAGLLAGLVMFAGTLLLVIPGIIAACAVIAAVPAVVAEPIGAGEAVKRSFTLTKGRRFSIFVAALVTFLVAWVAAMIGGFLPLFLGGGTASLLGAFVGMVVLSVATPLWTLLPAVVYHDLRVEKEGVDTAALAQVFE